MAAEQYAQDTGLWKVEFLVEALQHARLGSLASRPPVEQDPLLIAMTTTVALGLPMPFNACAERISLSEESVFTT
jgi:hypothetical protein